MRIDLIKKIQLKNPGYTKDQIEYIIKYHLKTINTKIAHNNTIDMTVPKLGRIHTHGNAIDKTYTRILKKQRIKNKKIFNFSEKELLF